MWHALEDICASLNATIVHSVLSLCVPIQGGWSFMMSTRCGQGEESQYLSGDHGVERSRQMAVWVGSSRFRSSSCSRDRKSLPRPRSGNQDISVDSGKRQNVSGHYGHCCPVYHIAGTPLSVSLASSQSILRTGVQESFQKQRPDWDLETGSV